MLSNIEQGGNRWKNSYDSLYSNKWSHALEYTPKVNYTFYLFNYDHTSLLSDMNFFHLNISLNDTYQLIIMVWSRPILTILSFVKLVVRRMLSRKMFKSWHENVCDKNQELWISWPFNIAFEVMKDPFSTTCFKDFH